MHKSLKREAPDFIVRVEGRTVGVEVTELFISHDASQSPLQVQESISTRIVLRARQIYEESGASPVHVSVCFSPGRDLCRLNMKETGCEAAQTLVHPRWHSPRHAGQSSTGRMGRQPAGWMGATDNARMDRGNFVHRVRIVGAAPGFTRRIPASAQGGRLRHRVRDVLSGRDGR